LSGWANVAIEKHCLSFPVLTLYTFFISRSNFPPTFFCAHFEFYLHTNFRYKIIQRPYAMLKPCTSHWSSDRFREFGMFRRNHLVYVLPKKATLPLPKTRAFRTSESENFGLWKHFGLGLSVFVCLRIYTVKKSTFHKTIPKFQLFLS
jgi:hypothetical protein